jgi:hypothetical protein
MAVLKPGGVAVFSECIRPFSGQPIYVEFIFNFLTSFRNVTTNPETRPVHGFLTPGNWVKTLETTGFRNVTISPNVEAISAHYAYFLAAAVTAYKDAGRDGPTAV